MKRKAGDVAARPADPLPRALPVDFTANRACRVFDQWNPAALRNRHELREIARHPELVHGQNRFSSSGEICSASTNAGSILKVARSMSTNTGVAPQCRIAFAVAMNEWLTVITSSPTPTPSASSARCSAVVQLDTAHACSAPTAAANSRSNAATSGPCVTQPERIARRAASASRSSIQGRATGIIVRTLIGYFACPRQAPMASDVSTDGSRST